MKKETFMEGMRRRIFRAHRLAPKFYDVFHLQLGKYSDPITGFDIIKFDKDLHVPKGKSLADTVQERYGEEGVKLVKELLLA